MQNIKVLISSPADQSENVKTVFSVIDEFNDLMSKRKVHFESVHWQKNIATGRGKRAQDVINTQIQDTDMIIAIVGTRLGTDTGVASSGTAEEVFDFCERVGFEKNNFNTHVFFNTKFDGNVLSLDTEQLDKVQNFQQQVSELGVMYAPFSNSSTLGKLIRAALDSFYFQSEQTAGASLVEEDLDELGLEEYFEAGSKNLEMVSEILKEIGSAFDEFNISLGNVEDYDSKEALLEAGVKAMNVLGNQISTRTDSIQDALDSTYTNTMSGTEILIEDFDKDENKEEVFELLKSMHYMIENSEKSFISLVDLETTIKAIPRRNKNLIKAKKKVLSPILKLKKTIADFNNNMRIVCDNLESYIS